MNTPSNMITEKISGMVDWLAQKRWDFVAKDTTDALQVEIHQLKKTLSNAPTRPTRAVRNLKSLEPVTEQQKITDLAG